MKTNRLFLPLIAILVTAALVLSACGAIQPTPNANLVQTAAAQTVQAQLTQMAFATLAARVTQLSQPTAQPGQPTNTLAPEQPTQEPPTNTAAVPTNTAVPPTNTVVPPTKTRAPVPTATPKPLPCNLISKVEDRTYADGTVVNAGEKFVKTWRLYNGGTCTWTADYDLVFVDGDAMSSPAAVDLNASVAPNQYIDVSVTLVAPNSPDTYTGYFMLRNASGGRFGWGDGSSKSFWVEIKVVSVKPDDPDTVYDFVKHYCDAADWITSLETIGCPSSKNNTVAGSIMRSYSPVLEGGRVENEPALIVAPDDESDGKIIGKFTDIVIKDGYHFRSVVACADKAPKCNVKFEVTYNDGSGTVSLGEWIQKSDDSFTKMDIDLSALSGQTITLYLRVESRGDSTDDIAVWLAPRLSQP